MDAIAPPPVIDSARVVAYALVDTSIPFTNRQHLYVGGELLGRVPRLAICQTLDDRADWLLFHCDNEWNVLGCSGGTSFEVVQAGAEPNYPGLMPHWVLTGVTRDDALAYYDGELGGLKCSFCGKRGFEIERGWVEGNDAAICATCVGKFHARLQSRDSE